jgi:hypothetical protein
MSMPGPVDPVFQKVKHPGRRLGLVIWSSRSHRRRPYIIAAAKPRRHPIRKFLGTIELRDGETFGVVLS